MIVAEKHADVFGATEELLLVPISTGPYHKPTGGFARAVEKRFPDTGPWLRDMLADQELRAGEVKVYEPTDRSLAAYALAFAGIHMPEQDGWQHSPTNLEIALYNMPPYRLGRAARIATAGIPGTGFSGLKGNVNVQEMYDAIERSTRSVVIYHRNLAGDRGPLTFRAPTLV